MASSGVQLEEIQHLQESPPDPAFIEAQKWIEQVTGRSFAYKDFRTGLENGILLCELLNTIKPGLVKKINRLPTPIAGLDNIILFLRGCKELGLKDSQLFDPGDLQDSSNRVTVKNTDCNRKLKNVLVTIYWLGKAANNCTSFNGAILNLKEFEGLLTQMRKETEDIESPRRSIRDSGYIDCWDSERSDSLSPPRHGRDDSFDSLDSFGSRSQQTPSPDVVLRGSSDGRGSDSESELPHRRIPDMKKDDMLARRTSYGEIKTTVPFNQYLPNKSNQTAYIPAPLRKKRAERGEYRKSWSTATSPLGGERPFSESHPETIMEEQSEALQCEKDEPVQEVSWKKFSRKQTSVEIENNGNPCDQSSPDTIKEIPADQCEMKEAEEIHKSQMREEAGIKVMPAAKRYGSQKQAGEDSELAIILRKENAFLTHRGKPSDLEEDEEDRVPDIEKDDLAMRRLRIDQTKTTPPLNQIFIGAYTKKDGKWESVQKPLLGQLSKILPCSSENYGQPVGAMPTLGQKASPLPEPTANESEEEEGEKVPDIQRDDLANRKAQNCHSQLQETKSFIKASITKADLKTWERLRLSAEASANETTKIPEQAHEPNPAAAVHDDFTIRKARAHRKGASPRQKFVHFGPVTEIDQQRWAKLSIAKPVSGDGSDEEANDESASVLVCDAPLADVPSHRHAERKTEVPPVPEDSRHELAWPGTDACHGSAPVSAVSQKQTSSKLTEHSEDWEREEKEEKQQLPDTKRDDMMVRRLGAFQKHTGPGCNQFVPVSVFRPPEQKQKNVPQNKQKDGSLPLAGRVAHYRRTPSPVFVTCMVMREERPEELKCQRHDGDEMQIGTRLPGLEKEDMMTQSTGTYKQARAASSQFLSVPISKQQEDEETTQGLAEAEKVMRTVPAGSSLLERHLQTCSPLGVGGLQGVGVSQQKEENASEEEPVREPEQDGQGAHPAPISAQPNQSLDQVLPGPAAHAEEVPERTERQVLRFSPRPALSDDTESMSMFDMRDEEEAVVQPHTRAYQEQLQNVNRQLKEEDEKWQDDLARWKNRRRSASQDLIKKEEERKKLERLISGEYDLSERRRSIKTYKEIVEEKERREKELHEAYKKAASREEAEMVLQKYVEKFTISEAILERLQMPKNLERRYSVESSSLSPSKEPSPMKYLRQQSLPAPKYTATFEATIVPTSESEAAVSTDLTSSNKAVVTKAVPMLTPKPYSQPKNKQVLKTFKVDGKESMNGEVCNGIEERERGCAAFAPSLSRSQMFEGVARVAESPTEPKQDTANVELSLKNPKSNSVSKELTVRSEHNDTIREETEAANQREETDSAVCAEWQNLELVLPEGFKQSEKASGHFSASVTSLEFTPSYHPKEPVAKDTDQSGGAGETCVAVTQKEVTSKADDQDGGRVFEYFKTVPETCQVIPHTPDQQVDSNSSEKSAHQVLTPSVNASKHFNFWAWDPEEERKRQERWQQEQERLLQERYQKEQEKLKEEWVKAQKEVEEEERKYYEEERKIIEDTVVPLSTSLSSADLPSSSNSSSTAQTNRNSQPLERALPEQEEEPESHTQVAESSSGAYQVKQRTCETIREQQDLMWDLDEGSFHKSREGEMWKEKKSVNKVTAGHPEPAPQRASEQGQQMLMAGQDSSAGMNLNLLQDTSWDHEFLTKESCVSKDVRLKTPPLDYGSSHKVYSTGGMKRTSSSENVRVGQASPCSPSQQCQSPNRYKRSVSGKKLCSSCGLPLGKGAAMIIETLNLYFHIQCFKCGICKGELGDVATGTDVRIRNGVLNCNDCYIRSRTAGQPTTL
ncbi:LIM and calponin homology domains-containing protein 1 isoform X3 [Rhinatrema bivittatum]|uniref:LIM and calponin homology domains-containing protein 1 isoform X3 n=1 Tax=Rhinatrema bivittatum TaxID=194408 RepID=UPI00112908F8|nr:LIM and calponin homology domains-containing protein 1 isoform X3 [Rhinatrema bivittatum]